MMNLFSGKSSPSQDEGVSEPLVLLVIQADAYNWPEIFKDVTVKGRKVEVTQAGFDHITVGPVENYSKDRRKRCCVNVNETCERDGREVVGEKKRRTIFPDLVLVRNCVWTHCTDFRNVLYAFMHCNLPCVNSLESIYMFLERPVAMGLLNKLRDEHGEEFPVIDQAFSPGYREMMYPLPFPAVVKVGAAHAGFGKMKITNHHDMHDFKSVLAMAGGKYCSMEPYVEGIHDLRIQCIGSDIKAFTRQDVSGEWKTNTGTSICAQIPVTPLFRKWVSWVRPAFGGLDIFTIDAVQKADGSCSILEVNDTSSGLFPDVADEDNLLIKEIVMKRLEKIA